jgi:hypothetical protein
MTVSRLETMVRASPSRRQGRPEEGAGVRLPSDSASAVVSDPMRPLTRMMPRGGWGSWTDPRGVVNSRGPSPGRKDSRQEPEELSKPMTWRSPSTARSRAS